MEIKICPHCESFIAEETLVDDRCPFCGKKIIKGDSYHYDSDINLYKSIENGLLFAELNKFDELLKLGNDMLNNYPKCFWTYCFLAIGDIKINITKPIDNISYQLNKKEIQEDMKTRIYHKARYKYVKSTQATYEAICEHYPDIPGEKRGMWNKCLSNYDKKLENIKSKLELFKLVENKYLSQMEIYAISEKEMAIVHNFKLWGEYLKHGLEELKKYDSSADDFVNKDFKKTPNPGNKLNYTLYFAFLLSSIFLFISAVSPNILQPILRNDIFFIVDIIVSSFSSLLFILLVGFLLYKGKTFNEGHVFVGALIIVLTIVIAILHVFFVFHSSIFKYIVNSLVSLGGLVGIVFAIFKMKYYLPRNTYVNGTYIGNYKALVTNNFEVDFHFNWTIFDEGHEDEVGTVDQYLSPYLR